MKVYPKNNSYIIFTVSVLLVTFAPSLLNFFGFDFGQKIQSFFPAHLSDSDRMHIALHGSFIHALLEWSAVFAALITALLAMVNYQINRESFVLIVASALLCGGLMDGFHILSSIHIISATNDAARLAPFTWALARIFYIMILVFGLSIVFLRNSGQFSDSRFGVYGAVFLMTAVSIVTMLVVSSMSILPVTLYPDSIFKRPFDLVTLGLFLTIVPVLLLKMFRIFPGMFSFSLLISLIPQVAAQFYMALGSGALFDNSFQIAHFLKVVAYVIPLTGVCLHYIQNLKGERSAVERIIQSQKLAFLGQVSSGAAHEINNPLTVVRGLSEVLEYKARGDRLDTADVIRISGLINQNVDRIIRIIQSLKMLSGESVGTGGRQISVKDLFGHMLDLSKERAGKYGVTILVGEVPERVAVVGEASELIQLLLNLVQNALDALEHTEKGRIQLTAYCNLNNQVEISIEDNGPGITAESRKGLFTPFFTTRDVGRGVGLGLGTALSIARKYGGDITFERYAPGVKVVLELPMVEVVQQIIPPLDSIAV